LDQGTEFSLRLDCREQTKAGVAIAEFERAAQRPGRAAPIIVPQKQVEGPAACGPLKPDTVGPGNVVIGTVVLVQRLLRDVVQAERGLEPTDTHAPGGVGLAVLQIRLVDGALAVLQPGRS